MHIPDGFLSNPVCAATTATTLVGLAGTAALACRKKDAAIGSLTAMVGAGIFAGQMVNFPIAEGTSGHLIGAALATALLGPYRAIVAMISVLVVQSLLFGDGGVSALGANIFNMAIIGVLTSYATLQIGDRFRIPRLIVAAIASWVSVVAAAGACALEMAFSGTQPLGVVMLAMMKVHAVIGLGEAVITIGVLAMLGARPADARSPRWILGVATASALLLSPWASSLPDGLEYVAEALRLQTASAAWYAAPLPDYGSAHVATIVAGIIGISIVSFSVYLLERFQIAIRRS